MQSIWKFCILNKEIIWTQTEKLTYNKTSNLMCGFLFVWAEVLLHVQWAGIVHLGGFPLPTATLPQKVPWYWLFLLSSSCHRKRKTTKMAGGDHSAWGEKPPNVIKFTRMKLEVCKNNVLYSHLLFIWIHLCLWIAVHLQIALYPPPQWISMGEMSEPKLG